MAVADFFENLGRGFGTGAKAVGAVLEPIAKRTAEVVSGEAPEIDREKRQRASRMEDTALDVKANEIEQQLQMGRQYGTLTPDQQNQLIDQLSALYSHPSQAPNLMQRLQRIVHPKGTTYTPNTPAPVVPNAMPPGGTAAADEALKEKSLAATLKNQEELAKYRQDIKPDTLKPIPGVHPFLYNGKYYSPMLDSETNTVVNKEIEGYTPPEPKPIFRNLGGRAVLLDPHGNVLKDLGPSGSAHVTKRQVMEPGDDGQMHLVTLTSVSTPGGQPIDVQVPQEGAGVPQSGSPQPKTQVKPLSHTMQKPTTGARPVQPSGSTVIPGFSGMAHNKLRTPSQTKADKDVNDAVALSTQADEVAKHPNDAINQKRLAVALERVSAGRFTTQALDYIIKAGWGNTLEQWANNPTTGALPADVMRQLVDGAHQNLTAKRAAQNEAYGGSNNLGLTPPASTDEKVTKFLKNF